MSSISSLSNVFTSILHIAIAIIILLVMVLIHELGHYIAGRAFNFKINEFAVGFGKAIFQRTNKRGEKVSLRLFPLGGYCAFEGENDEEEDGANPDAFNTHAPWKRIIVYIAGPLFNILSAIIFSFLLLVTIGYDIPKVVAVDSYYSNAQVIEVGDIIYEVGGKKIDFVKDNTLVSLLAGYEQNEEIELKIKRDGQMTTIVVKLQHAFDSQNNLMYTEEGAPILKLGIQTKAAPHTFGEALVRAVPFTLGLSWRILKTLILALTFQLPAGSLSGPIGAIGTIASQTQQSLSSILVLLPLISVNLGVFNLLPIPALDGARVVFTTIEWIRRKPISRKVEAYIHAFGLIALLALVVILDILKLVI